MLCEEIYPLLKSKEASRESLCRQVFSHADTQKCLEALGYAPMEKEMFLEALTHASFANRFSFLNINSYERLEFLGDSLIGTYMTGKIFAGFPTFGEGQLSRFRSTLVNRDALASLGRPVGLERVILLAPGEFEQSLFKLDSLISDCVEALIGSVFLERGSEGTAEVLDRLLSLYEREYGRPFIDEGRMDRFDYKSQLQELTAKMYGEIPTYTAEKIGESSFRVSLFLKKKCLGKAEMDSKKEAEKYLAAKAVQEKLYILEGGQF